MPLHRVKHPTDQSTCARYGYDETRDAYVVIVHADGGRVVFEEPQGAVLSDEVLRSMMRSLVMYGFFSNGDWKEALSLLRDEPQRRPPKRLRRVARVIQNLLRQR